MIRALILASLLPLAAQAEEVRIVHYNIKELDSVKLLQGQAHPQVAAASDIIRKLNPDFLSINEIQFDQVNVPSASNQSRGQNMRLLTKLAGLDWPAPSIGFGPANTGANARKRPGTNEYSTDTAIRDLSDPVNFGVFPAEYSTGGATRFPVVHKTFVHKLKWKEFRPDRDLSKFKDANKNPLDPATVELFDKNFTDMVVKIAGKDVHFILLHTVPAHDFGNEGSPNGARNADQLAFLEWYLTGTTEFTPPANLKIKPLPPGSLFVAMGDWNIDVRNTELPGSAVLQRLFTKTKQWMSVDKLGFTYESQPFYVPPFREQLDYIITSPTGEIQIKDGGVYAPFERMERGCNLKGPKPSPLDPNRVVVSYKDKATGARCFAEVSADYAQVKTASDHRPLWAVLEIK